jgi:hypothetical protein
MDAIDSRRFDRSVRLQADQAGRDRKLSELSSCQHSHPSLG